MVVAYAVTSHRLPGQVLRLLRTLRALSPAAPLLVHHDPRFAPLDARAVAAVGGVRLVAPEPAVEWGRASHLRMLRRVVHAAVTEEAFDWLVLLSGQDYPIRPLAQVEADLAATSYDGFVEGHVVAPPAWDRDAPEDDFARRYFSCWHRVPEPGRALRRTVQAARPLLSIRTTPSGVLLGHRVRAPFATCRRGADWLTVNRRCAELLDDAPRALVRHFERTLLPTEAFPHTVLHGHAGLRLSGDGRRYTRWDAGALHPQVLTADDLETVLASTADFARKFDEGVDARVLDLLDERLGR